MIEGLHAIHLSGFIHNDMKPNTVKPRLSGLIGTSVNSPDNRESG